MILLALLLSLTSALPADAVRILVVDARTQAPLPGVRVQLQAAEEARRQIHVANTGTDGVAAFDAVAPGSYVLTVSTIGYAFVRRGVTVTAGSPLALTIPLAEGTGTYQEDVVVTAASSGAPEIGVSSQTTIGSATIQDLRGIASDDPMRAVQALPGVSTGDDFQAEFSVRGSAFRHVGIVIDDTPSPLLLHAVRGRDDTGSLAMINADVLDRASLAAGPHPQRHGEWIGATLEFGLRSGSRDRARVSGTVSGTSASAVIEGPLGAAGRGAWLVTARKSYVDWLVRKLDPAIESTIGFSDAQGKLVWDLTGRQQVQMVVIGGQAVYREPNASIANGLHKAVSTGRLASLGWSWTGNATTMRQRASITLSEFTNTGQRTQVLGRGTTTMAMWRADVTRAFGARWLAEAGARVERTRTDQTLTRYRLQGTSVRQIATRRADGSRQVSASWGQIAWRGAHTGLSAGLRVVDAERPDGRWAAPWVLAEQRLGRLTLRAGAGTSRQLPPLEAALVRTDEVRDERAQGVDGSAELRLGRTGRLQVIGFARKERDILRLISEERVVNGAFVPALTFPVAASRLDGSSRGVDVVLQRTSTAGLSGWVAYTWAHTRYTDRVSGERFDGDYDQRHTINAFVQQRLSYRSAVNAKLRMGSNVPLVGYFSGDVTTLRSGVERNQVRLPWYVRLDVRANRTFAIGSRRLTLFAEVVNALGRRNLGQADGFVRLPGLEAVFYTEKLIPRVPSAGVLIEF